MEEATTPAPSLSELPPERGTILELHSINEEYNGKLVEFIKFDKKNDKYFVLPLKMELDGTEQEDENAQFMRVSPTVCRRPGLKPLELRELLANLAKQIHSSETEDSYNHSAVNKRLLGLLEKDPCCALAYMYLSESERVRCINLCKDHRGVDPPKWPEPALMQLKKSMDKKTTNLYRLLGNAYAYSDFVTEAELKDARYELSRFLVFCGHPNAAIRQQKKSQLLEGEVADSLLPESKYEFQAMLGLGMIKKALESKEACLFSKACEQFIQAVDHLMSAIKILAQSNSGKKVPDEFCISIRNSLSWLMEILHSDLKGQSLDTFEVGKELTVATFVASTIDKLCELRETTVILPTLVEEFWDRLKETKKGALDFKTSMEETNTEQILGL